MGEKNQISLDNLIAERGNKSMSRKLMGIHDQIEKAIAAGITYEEILVSLKEQGFGEMTLGTFKVALHRIRKRKNKVGMPQKANASFPVNAPKASLPSSTPVQQSNPNQNSAASAWDDTERVVKMSVREAKEYLPFPEY